MTNKINDMTENLHLYDWMFHYNPYTKKWAAIPKDLKNEYFTNYKHPRIIRSSSIDTLVELLIKTEGDPKKLDKLVKK